MSKPSPWITVRAVLAGAFQSRLLEPAVNNGPWSASVRPGVRVSENNWPTQSPSIFRPSALGVNAYFSLLFQGTRISGTKDGSGRSDSRF